MLATTVISLATVTPSCSGAATAHRSLHRRATDRSLARSRRQCQHVIPTTVWIMVFAAAALFHSHTVQAALLQGCNFDETLCEASEACIPDGLFGQCYSNGESEALKPLVVDGPLDPVAQELLQLELRRLAAADLNWPHARIQCTLAYFKFSVVYGLSYDAQFCTVNNPNNVWALIQEVQTVLASENEAREELLQEALQRNGLLAGANGPKDKLDEADGAAEAPADAFPAPLVNDNNESTEESQLRPTAADNDSNNNDRDVFDAAINQLQIRAAEKERRSANGQVAIDLADNNVTPVMDVNEYAILSRLPPGLLVDADALAQRLSANDAAMAATADGQRAASWNAWLAAMLVSDGAEAPLPQLSAGEKKQLNDYVTNLLNNRRADPSALNDSQLKKLVAFINSMKVMLQQKAAQLQQQAASKSSAPEIEEVIPLTSESNEKQLLLKKDSEKFNNADMGLANTVHKIVKGSLQRVEGNRGYLKINEHGGTPLNERQLMRLVDYLDRKIAAPNDLLFDAFAYESGQLSFRVSRVKFLPTLQRLFENLSLDGAMVADEEEASAEDGEKERETHAASADVDGVNGDDSAPTNKDSAKKGDAVQSQSVSGIALALYKRRKDIETLADLEVDETKIGSGVNILPISIGTARRDWFFASATAVCAIALLVVASFLAMQLVRARRDNGDLKRSVSGLPEVIDYIEGEPDVAYEDLFRQRMSSGSEIVDLPGTSRLYDEFSLDISTGHIVLSFLRNCLEKPDEISNQWSQLAGYQNVAGEKQIAGQPENADKNLDAAVVPYDDSVLMVSLSTQFRTGSRPSSNEQPQPADDSPTVDKRDGGVCKYLNASRIYDADPRQPVYIAAQAPLTNTVAEFWQAVWQENINVIVNLADWNEFGGDNANAPIKYWKPNIYDALEVRLVSEHSFNQDYVVRSIFLKNLKINDTRTVTQFHYVSWENGGLPRSIESLLDFRRKVNKSWKGGPVLVHCSNGAGRTGTYILTDMVVKRILKGVKELNIAASLEHLRDQRMSLIDNEAQYKLVFRCVAEEVSVLLKNLQH